MAAAIGAWMGFMVRRQGVFPRLSKAPADFASALRSNWIGVVVLLVMIVAVYFAVGSEVAALVAAIGVFVGAVLYQRRFDKAAAALRARLK